MRSRIVIVGAVLLTALAGLTRAAEPAGEESVIAGAGQQGPSIYLEIRATTWRRHQMAGVPVAPTIRSKLRDAGFTLVHEPQAPHDFVLRIDYQETRGGEVSFGEWQTDMTCAMTLEHPQHGVIGQWTVQTTPAVSTTSRVSYIDSQYELQSHPYIFFLGELVRRASAKQPDTAAVLVEGLAYISRERVNELVERTPDNWNAHGTAPIDAAYVPMAVQKTIYELVRLKDERAVPVFIKLVRSRDAQFRLDAVQALGMMGATEARPVLETAASQDRDIDVRRAAQEALRKFNALSRAP
jgi:hypothetical protein